MANNERTQRITAFQSINSECTANSLFLKERAVKRSLRSNQETILQLALERETFQDIASRLYNSLVPSLRNKTNFYSFRKGLFKTLKEKAVKQLNIVNRISTIFLSGTFDNVLIQF